ncbi:MAG TPA: VOC family protein [Candidatus Krumholzibacteria bacterium]|nr:VOC family protein [Candidatus Krumholzibacteria bacterium]
MREPIDLTVTHGTWEGSEILHPGPGVPERIEAEGRSVCTPVLGGNGTASEYVHRRAGEIALEGHIVVIPSSRDEEDVSMHWMSAVSKTVVFRGRFRDGVLDVRADVDGRFQRIEQDYSEPDVMKTRTFVGTDPKDLPLAFEATYRRQPDPRIGAFVWHDLTVDDAPALRDFYAAVVGWKSEPVSMGDYDDFGLVAASGEQVAGVCHARGENAEVPPVWMSYVRVADLEASLRRAAELGGRVVVTTRTHGRDRYAVVADPVGAVLTLYQQD